MKYHCKHCRAYQRTAELVRKLYKNPTRTEQSTIQYLQSKAKWYTDNHITAQQYSTGNSPSLQSRHLFYTRASPYFFVEIRHDNFIMSRLFYGKELGWKKEREREWLCVPVQTDAGVGVGYYNYIIEGDLSCRFSICNALLCLTVHSSVVIYRCSQHGGTAQTAHQIGSRHYG